MIWPAESIYSGSWGGSEMPLEVRHFELMREMGWSFADLQSTPPYVVRYCTDLMMIRRQAEADEMEKARRETSNA